MSWIDSKQPFRLENFQEIKLREIKQFSKSSSTKIWTKVCQLPGLKFKKHIDLEAVLKVNELIPLYIKNLQCYNLLFIWVTEKMHTNGNKLAVWSTHTIRTNFHVFTFGNSIAKNKWLMWDSFPLIFEFP